MNLLESLCNRGKKQAIGSVIISILILFPYFSGLSIGSEGQKSNPFVYNRHKKSERTERIFKNLNFKYTLPGKSFTELDAQSFNPDAILVARRTWPEVYFMIIAERGGIDVDMDNQRLCNISKANLDSGAQSTKLLKEEEYTVNGMKGIRFYTDVEIDGQKFVYVHWIYSHNGFWYQLITTGFQKDRSHLHRIISPRVGCPSPSRD